MDELETFLRDKAEDAISSQDEFYGTIVSYQEDQNNDALSDAWLDNATSYIWKVGVLAVVDGNKRDWAELYIGIQRTDDHKPKFIGMLSWNDGENDDPGRVLKRAVRLAQYADIVFEDR